MYQSQLDIHYAHERHNQYLVAARIARLIRSAPAANHPPARPARKESLLARVFASLWAGRPARA